MFSIFNKIDSKLVSKIELDKIISTNEKALKITFVNPYSYLLLSKNESIVDEMDIILSDGALHTFMHNLFNRNKIDRASFDFSSIAHPLFQRASTRKLNIAIIGGANKEPDIAVEGYKSIYANLVFSYVRHGYFKTEEEMFEVITAVYMVKPDIIIAGMGTPLQEKFIIACSKYSESKVELYTCGGFIEQSSIRTDYYHPIIKKTGMRWLQRAIANPHVRKRLLTDYPRFLVTYVTHGLSKWFR
mgnify:CR=1 FL=1